MSVDPTKSISSLSHPLNRDLINLPQGNTPAPTPTTVTKEKSQVNLSPSKSLLLNSHDNDIDLQKVEQIKQQIRDGQFVINEDKIADSLIQQSLELVNSEE